jgi:hypothetical protein
MKKLLDDANALARELDDTRFATVMGPPPSKAAPSTDACPIDGKKMLPEPPGADATENAKRAFNARLLSATLTVADVVDPGGNAQRSLHPAMSALDKALEPHESVVKGGPLYGDGAKFIADLEKSLATWREGGDGFLVQKLREEATLSGSAITPGRVKGRFYLVSRKEKRITCVADIDVTGPRGFLAWGETNADVTRNAATQLPLRLTGEAVIDGLMTMRAAK